MTFSKIKYGGNESYPQIVCPQRIQDRSWHFGKRGLFLYFIFSIYALLAYQCVRVCAFVSIFLLLSLGCFVQQRPKNAVNGTKSPATRCKHSNDRLMRLTYIDFFSFALLFFLLLKNQKSVNPVTCSNKTQILLPGKTCLFL